jgi:replication initiation protein RepC
MQTITTPFGRRPLSLGAIAAQMRTDDALGEAAKPGSNHPSAVNKWALFRTLTVIRERLGVSDRSLSLLNALLTFHPETALTLPKPSETDEASLPCDLVVFPSNKALALRAHGMAEKTLRRHLACLVEAGLIIRRDSPNGKRYARKAGAAEGERFSDVFGFDLTPLVARAPEFETLADDTRRASRARAVLKERVSLRRRDASKLITLGLDDAIPGDWEALRQRFMGLVTPLRRIHDDLGLESVLANLTELCSDAETLLQGYVQTKIMTANASQNERHQSNSNTDELYDFEPASEKEGGSVSIELDGEQPLETKQFNERQQASAAQPPTPLGLVLEACPDVREYASGPVKSWPQFVETARTIRPMLGISPDAWLAAVNTMGEQVAATVIAIVLQRSEYSSEAQTIVGEGGKSTITVNGSPAVLSAGGYLRALTEKAEAGAFSPGPVLMALIGQRMKLKRGASGAGR